MPYGLTWQWCVHMAAQNRLCAAGIKTYAELAKASPEEVRRALGKLARGANVEKWIAEARGAARERKMTPLQSRAMDARANPVGAAM